MQETNASVRVQKLDEAKDIIVELEEQKGMELGGPRGALFRAGGTVDSGQAYIERVIESLPREAAGFGNCVHQLQRPARRSFG